MNYSAIYNDLLEMLVHLTH